MSSTAADQPKLSAAIMAWGAICLVPLAGTHALTSITADATALSMVGLTLFVGASVLAFSRRHMRVEKGRIRYFALIGATLVATLLLVLTDHLLVLLAAWIASGALLAQLIGHHRDWDEAQAAARRAQWTFAGVDSLLLCTLALAAARVQDQSITGFLVKAGTLPTWLLVLTVGSLVLAALARCAVPPFSSWLLMSATAPTPVSALMHAGLVNAGGYLLIRFAPLLEMVPAARIALVLAGLTGAVAGAAIMLVRPDIKRSLAASTISQMGFMVMTCGLGAYAAALWHIVAHGLFKAWLFLNAGQTVRRGKPQHDRTLLAGWIMPAALVVGIGLAMVLIPLDRVSLVPTVLAVVTAVFALVSALQSASPAHCSVLAGMVLVLAAGHALGLGALNAVLPSAHTALPLAVQLTVILVILGSLAWQHHLFTGRGELPAWLYARLLNAGRPARTRA
jgi:NAD(P)H-quinone oxidoreductase subunit 5